MWQLPESDKHFLKARKKGDYQHHIIDAGMKYTGRRTAIDIGAHVGFLSVKMARHFRKVIAFEPNAENIACFRLNCPDIPIIPVALGGQISTGTMSNPCPINSGAWEIGDGNHITILPMDMFVLSDVDLIKIDTQGFEAAILRGAKSTIEKWRPVLIIEAANKRSKEIDSEVNAILKNSNFVVKKIIGRDIIAVPEEKV